LGFLQREKLAELKNALVTGGSRGIGREIVKELALGLNGSPKCNIAFVYRSCDECAEEIIIDLKDSGVRVLGLKGDVSSFDDAQKNINKVIEEFGSVDFLVNNAGITRDNLLLRMSEQDFDDVINANLKSVFNYSKAVLRPMIKQRFGKIVNISSVVGIIGNPGQANYVASKAGVIGFTKSIAREVASRSINVNAVAPGFIQTDMTSAITEQQREALQAAIPLKRLGTSADVAKMVGFLCSSNSDYITGQVFAVDGGMTM